MSTTQELIDGLREREVSIPAPELGVFMSRTVPDPLCTAAADRLASLSAELDALKEEVERLRGAAKSALKRLEKGAPGWGVAKDELRAALTQGGAG